MISKSDLIILLVSVTVLGAGLYRWQRELGAPLVAGMPPGVERAVGERADAVTARVAPSTGDDAAALEEPIVVRRVPDTGSATAVDPTIGARAREDRTATVPSRIVASEPETTVAVPASTTRPTDGAPLYGRYVIREGDYLGKLANRFGTSVATLQSINDLDDTTIHVGEELRYPLPAN